MQNISCINYLWHEKVEESPCSYLIGNAVFLKVQTTVFWRVYVCSFWIEEI